SYDIQRQAADGGDLSERTVEADTTEFVWEPLRNGESQRFRVRAHNLSEQPSEWSGWSRPENPAGAPMQLPGPIAAERVNDPLGGGVQVSWRAADADTANGEPISSYLVTGSDGSSAR